MIFSRQWQFARHIPPRRIAARLWIRAKRAALPLFPVSDRLVARSASPPMPILPPRAGMIASEEAGWRFTFLHRSVAMPAPVEWRAPGEGQLWRMNLHYFEYLEELGAADGLALIESWIASNDTGQARSWGDAWSSYALSIRLVCWTQFLARHEVANRPAILASLARQVRALSNFLETDIGGNHLIKNIKALAWASAFFEGAEAKAWRSLATTFLEAELPKQVLPDGVHFERSPSYHNQVLADLTECRAALGAHTGLDEAIVKMVKAAAALTHPDGGPAQFNDAGLTMAYPASALSKVVSPEGGFELRDSGFYAFAGPGVYFVAKMGRIGADDLPAHAHGDIGSFELSVAGQRMIVDQGVFEYIAGERRNRARATASHNCLSIGGRSQADFYGAFRCGRRPMVVLIESSATADRLIVAASHDGFGKAGVTRRFDVTASRIRIEDGISARTGEPARVALLLHPECTVTVEGNVATVTRGGARLTISADHPLSAEPAVWWPDMGVELPTTRLCLTLPADCLESALEIAIRQGDAPERA